jgi:hypothetical protein
MSSRNIESLGTLVCQRGQVIHSRGDSVCSIVVIYCDQVTKDKELSVLIQVETLKHDVWVTIMASS